MSEERVSRVSVRLLDREYQARRALGLEDAA